LRHERNIFEEEGIVRPPKAFGCRREPGLNDNRSATALNRRLQMLTNTPDLCLNGLPFPLPSPPLQDHLDLIICSSVDIKTGWPKQSFKVSLQSNRLGVVIDCCF